MTLSHSNNYSARSKNDATKKYLETISQSNLSPATRIHKLLKFIQTNLNVEQSFLASELKEDALQTVLENNYDINIDNNWWEYDDTPVMDMEDLGLEIDTTKMSWDLEARYRQLYFHTDGIHIADMDKLLKALVKDIKLTKKLIDAIKDDTISLHFSMQHFGGGDGRSYFNYTDYTDKSITDSLKFNLDDDGSIEAWYADQKMEIETLQSGEIIFHGAYGSYAGVLPSQPGTLRLGCVHLRDQTTIS